MNWQERAEKAEAALAKAREQRDGLAAKLAELCEQKPVVKYMSRRLTPVGTKEMWGYDLVDGLSDGTMLYAGPVQMPVVADCRTCKNRGRANGFSQESFCESCVWQLMSFRKNHYAPNSPDFEGIKILELPKNDAAPVPAVADMRDAYEGAREDLLDWKRRALEAERRLDHVLNDTQGAVKFGEPVPAVAAPAVPEEWRGVLRECAESLADELNGRYSLRATYPSYQRKYEVEMQPVYRARALLQSTGEKK